MRENLQTHILEYLEDFADIIGDCGCTAEALNQTEVPIPYLVETPGGGRECKCYNPLKPTAARWVGTYFGQATYLINGQPFYGNGGTIWLVVFPDGTFSVNGQMLEVYEYNEDTDQLTWQKSANVNTFGGIKFRESHTAPYHWSDKPDNTVGQSFTGFIRPSDRTNNGDYRGVLQSARSSPEAREQPPLMSNITENRI